MPSPFPGMDPYLENGDPWQGFHNRFMTYLCDAIQPALPPGFIARLELRIYIDRLPGSEPVSHRLPDLELLRTRTPVPPSGQLSAGDRSHPDIRGHWIDVPAVERREAYIDIRTMPDGDLVTSVELLSPSNKRPGSGRELYLRKQAEMLDAGVNLVEIDLLRAGAHTVAVEKERLASLQPFDYLACVFRDVRPWGFEVLSWRLRDPLPVIPMPLGAEVQELDLDLQSLFDRAYENAAFRKLVDYRGAPDPPLAPEDADWADELLRRAGLRGDAGA